MEIYVTVYPQDYKTEHALLAACNRFAVNLQLTTHPICKAFTPYRVQLDFKGRYIYIDLPDYLKLPYSQGKTIAFPSPLHIDIPF